MRTVHDIVAFIEQQPGMMRLLEAVDKLSLPDCWIGAGFVRNAVWDALHSRVQDCGNDIDVAFFDSANLSAERDAAIEAALRAAQPEPRWDVKNQARMHHRNGDLPYLNTQDAIARWPETATAVAVRHHAGRVTLIAPHGITDLVGLIVRPTPAFVSKSDVIANRVRTKGWQSRWPRLTVLAE